MRIFVDADACPVKELIVKQAKTRRIPVVMVMDTSHLYRDGYSQIVTVDKGADSADFKLISLLAPGDLVVTQDFGVAAMALGKGALALGQSGLVYDHENIDRLLFERHLGKEVRRAGGRTAPVKKRSPSDDKAFAAALVRLLDQAERGEITWP